MLFSKKYIMSDVIETYVNDEPNAEPNDEPHRCKLSPVYPCILSHQTCLTCFDSCDQAQGTSCDYLIGCCLPITVSIDLITLIPISIVYSVNKLFRKKF